MADDADIASGIEAENLAIILANREKSTNGVSAVECDECGISIPQARRLALPGVQTCVHCEQLNDDAKHFKMGRLR